MRRRFNGPDYAKEAANQEDDNAHYALVFTYSAEAAAAEEAAAKEAAKAPKPASD